MSRPSRLLRSIQSPQDLKALPASKVKDLALIRLRSDLVRYAPDVAARFGLHADQQETLDREEDAVLEEEAA